MKKGKFENFVEGWREFKLITKADIDEYYIAAVCKDDYECHKFRSDFDSFHFSACGPTAINIYWLAKQQYPNEILKLYNKTKQFAYVNENWYKNEDV